MADEPKREGWLQFGVAAELAKKYGEDEREFLELLALLLADALPQLTQVERRGGWFAKRKPVQRIFVTLDENRYALEDPGHGPLRATRTRIVRGIALKTEDIPTAEWINDLGAALDERARASAATREALSRLVE